MHLAGADVELDVVERLHAGERLADVLEAEDGLHGVRLTRSAGVRASTGWSQLLV